MQKIGVLSDTHGKLREEIIDILRECDVILHAGDINTPKVLERLKQIAPTYAVRGNADKEWAKMLPVKLDEKICGLRVFMVHNKKELAPNLSGYDLVVYGHSHKYEEREDECFYLNPGSCGPRRFSLPVTMAVVEVENGAFRVSRKDVAPGTAGDSHFLTEHTLTALFRDVDRGRSVSEIAGKYKLEENVAKQVCRLYLTHPGIGAAGVLDKMGLPKDR